MPERTVVHLPAPPLSVKNDCKEKKKKRKRCVRRGWSGRLAKRMWNSGTVGSSIDYMVMEPWWNSEVRDILGRKHGDRTEFSRRQSNNHVQKSNRANFHRTFRGLVWPLEMWSGLFSTFYRFLYLTQIYINSTWCLFLLWKSKPLKSSLSKSNNLIRWIWSNVGQQIKCFNQA